MSGKIHKLNTITAAVALMSLFGVMNSHAAPPIKIYDITITNLTSGQPFTPPVVATHRRPLDVFEVGEPASFEVKEIAENGNVAPLAEALAANKHVFESMVGARPIFHGGGMGGTLEFKIHASPPAKYLSFVSMLICTNDGFTGLDAQRLPKKVGDSVTVDIGAYDAGTEMNTEDFADIVPPCQALVGVMSDEDDGTGASDPELAEGGVIHSHLGIIGGVDLVPAVHGWTDPVARVVITRTD
jgi:hypothetical protein